MAGGVDSDYRARIPLCSHCLPLRISSFSSSNGDVKVNKEKKGGSTSDKRERRFPLACSRLARAIEANKFFDPFDCFFRLDRSDVFGRPGIGDPARIGSSVWAYYHTSILLVEAKAVDTIPAAPRAQAMAQLPIQFAIHFCDIRYQKSPEGCDRKNDREMMSLLAKLLIPS